MYACVIADVAIAVVVILNACVMAVACVVWACLCITRTFIL